MDKQEEELQQNQEQQLLNEEETGVEKGANAVVGLGEKEAKKGAKLVAKFYLLKILTTVGPMVGALVVVIAIFAMVMSLVGLVGNSIMSIKDDSENEFSVFTIGENGINLANEDEIMNYIKKQLKASRKQDRRFRFGR